jgi:hypothetical protein
VRVERVASKWSDEVEVMKGSHALDLRARAVRLQTRK